MRTISLAKIILILVSFFSVAIYAEEASHGNPAVYTKDKLAIVVRPEHPEFVIRLESNRTTGYSWFLRAHDRNLIKTVKHVYEAPENKKLMGAPGYEVWTFRMKPEAFSVPQQTIIRFIYVRPWEASSSATQLAYKVTTTTK